MDSIQLALPFEAPAYLPLSGYDREPVGEQRPLTAPELAALAHHGYRLVEDIDGAAVFDTPDGLIGWDNDMWRSEIDIYYLIAKAQATG